MSTTKKFYELQDLILAKVSLEKVKLHIEERKDRTIFKWVRKELTGFFRKFSNVEEFRELVNNINKGLEEENYEVVLENIKRSLDIISEEIEKFYQDLQKMQ
ncbi:hypothetical protein SULI_00415 [Saccharolobus solfataricus]|uniref:Uncharacterized protein n=2 Tax=Saccharolobus solfataricus TaxID=2287 RepID=A0A0E3JSM7_SACSO|nr:hypothetical protein [Saccharolobus solfataricus]AKA72535.1 hypothetical protein SULB_0083 [Saccharolobus solfataricus]AKA75234.1 hypothetical protein SULC_0082 [Saccharolobus solfataricus]AKA77927.1 hypothetical protein SULA_0082 [Saccharolobus solfataricus]AZF67045.1 hypothetical protein SULG_00415 [Saccharolobus solfataricus]AZF69665.1 hypothetical protein SULH_00415 [Saccharolobus solfataricus]